MNARIDWLEMRCNSIEKKIHLGHDPEETDLEPRDRVGDVVDSYVDWWYERNKKDVDAGVIEIPIIGAKVDVFPDYLEKHMYGSMFKAMVNHMLDTEVTVAGVRMRMQAIHLDKGFKAPTRSTSASSEHSE